jgi:hypothetical protein
VILGPDGKEASLDVMPVFMMKTEPCQCGAHTLEGFPKCRPGVWQESVRDLSTGVRHTRTTCKAE